MSVSSSAAESLAGTPESSRPPSPTRKPQPDTELRDVRKLTDGDGETSSTETGVGPAADIRSALDTPTREPVLHFVLFFEGA